MGKRLANILSVLLHPMLMPTIFLAALAYTTDNILYPITAGNRSYFIALISVLTFFLPVFSVGFITKTFGKGSLQMENKSERIMPLVFTVLYYSGICYFFFSKFRINDIMLQSLTSTTVCIALALMINFFWKISLHSIGIGGVIGWIMAIQYAYEGENLLYQFSFFVLLAGIVGSIRLYLQQHNLAQIIAGYALGFLICFLSILIKI